MGFRVTTQLAEMSPFDLPEYLSFYPEGLLKILWDEADEVAGVAGLRIASGLREKFPHVECEEALQFVCQLYSEIKGELAEVLKNRIQDRAFLDQETRAGVAKNEGMSYLSEDYVTALGRKDASGRVVIGPLDDVVENAKVEIPDFLKGDQVTLFGPPDTAKLAINAMNAFNRKLKDEPAVVTELAEAAGQVPRWGADNEDSKTPIMEDFLSACQNLMACFEGTLCYVDERSGKRYELDDKNLAKPIKRIPGLALPDGCHLMNGNPLPLHLYDFAMHLWHNRRRKEALVFYVPKLENEEEARYLKSLIGRAEDMIKAVEPDYELGTVKVFLVFENPRAIFRIREMARELEPHFLGGSLGWHDFLASTARLFRHDPRYRIPVKADPDIVIKHIRESHRILVEALAPMGAIRIGGMYGILYDEADEASYEACMVGYVRDVTAQLKRGLNGFWVAHPIFVRVGLAMVEAWRRGRDSIEQLVKALVPDPAEHVPLLEFVFAEEPEGLDRSHGQRYLRGVLAANIEVSDVIANDDPEEVRYNVFQALQYLCDWLTGNGCVALPAGMVNGKGENVFVRVMDDLATTERSRWELWAEVHHGRVSPALFESILNEEVDFIRQGNDCHDKRIQVAWQGEAAKWYPIAVELLRQLVLDPNPVEFSTELMLPFTLAVVRDAKDPLAKAKELMLGKYR